MVIMSRVRDKHKKFTLSHALLKYSFYLSKTLGGYMLHEPDGTTRIVEYTSDKHNGFNAVVKKIGHAHHPQIYGGDHGHVHHEHGHAESYASVHL